MTSEAAAGALIPLEGTLNLRDLGGWTTATGRTTAFGHFYRSDRLSGLTDADHHTLDDLAIDTVVDLRYEAEVAEHPSLLWSTVAHHHEIPMGGELADQRSFIDRALAGEFDGITDADVADSYIDLLGNHAEGFGRAVTALLDGGAGLYHCTAGKDRTGLLSMLILGTVGVADDHILADFALSNEYRATKRMIQLRPTFEAAGLEIERFRPALSAPVPAMERALAWIGSEHETPERFLTEVGAVTNAGERLRNRLLA